MRVQKTGDYSCRFSECTGRVKRRQQFCTRCIRVVKEQLAAANSVLFPPPQPHTPKVYTIAPIDGKH